MRRLRYVYTPRRRLRSRTRPLAVIFPLALIAGVVLLALWVKGGEGGADTRRSSVLDAGCVTAECLDPAVRRPVAASVVQPPEQIAEPSESQVDADTPAPPITGQAAVVLEEPCGEALYSLNDHSPLPPASLTKIMTAVVTAERSDLSQQVKVDIDGAELSADTDSTVMGLAPGQTLSVRDLLYGMLLPSGNDAALALAEYAGGGVPEFVDLMNQKAVELGLNDTHFSNPHGLNDAGLYTSALDIATLGSVLLQNPDLAQIVGSESYQPAWDGPPVNNINLLIGLYPGAIGVKTGYTDEAGQTIVGAAERDGRRIIVSVMRSQDLFVDASALLDWAFASTRPACNSAGRPASPASGG